MSNPTTKVTVGPGFVGLLTLVFITLKLTGFISWSWLWVLSPIWISLGIPLAILIGFTIVELGIMLVAAIIGASGK